MYRPCLHCEGKKYDKDYCPEICTYGETIKRLKEIEDALKHGRLIYAAGDTICPVCRDEVSE